MGLRTSVARAAALWLAASPLAAAAQSNDYVNGEITKIDETAGKRLKNDMPYNLQVGAAEFAGLMQDYRGNYILAVAAYNAGRGRVREWIERFGDPRDPKVDSVDWVERIPFMETRNYVQRVMENLQVYRTLFGGNAPLTIDTDLRRSVATN